MVFVISKARDVVNRYSWRIPLYVLAGLTIYPFISLVLVLLLVAPLVLLAVPLILVPAWSFSSLIITLVQPSKRR